MNMICINYLKEKKVYLNEILNEIKEIIIKVIVIVAISLNQLLSLYNVVQDFVSRLRLVSVIGNRRIDSEP